MAYMFVSDEIAGKLELINDICKIKNEDIQKVINDMAKESEYMTESLQENTLRFKLFAKDIAKGYKDAVAEEVDSLLEVWEECDAKRTDVYKKTNEIKKIVEETRADIQSLKQSLEGLNVYGMDKVLELIVRFSNMSERDKDLLVKLAEVSK